MTSSDDHDAAPDTIRRRLVLGSGIAAGTLLAQARGAAAQVVRSDGPPDTLNGQTMPEPPPERSAGPIRAGRGSDLRGKVAVVTGAARGIGRAIAVEFAANGADVVAIDIAGPVSPASDAVPATPQELDDTVAMIHRYGRRGEALRADIRDIAALRQAADHVEATYGKIDIVVADAAIQRWVPLLEMEDADWNDVINNNLNGTANTIRAFAPKMVASENRGRIIVLVLDAGQARHQRRLELFGIQMGHPGIDEVGRTRASASINITVNALIPGLVDTALTRYKTSV